jgi:hypothetical protein
MAVLTTDAEIRAAVEIAKREPKIVEAIAARYAPADDRVEVAFENGIEIRFPRRSIDGLAPPVKITP